MALISCPDCNREVSSTAMKCEGCGCTLRKRVRGPVGKVIKWLFIIWNLGMLAWVIGGTIQAQQLEVHNDAERAGRDIGTAIGVSIILWMWFGGALFWGLFVLLTRPGESSPTVPVRSHRSKSATIPAAHALDEGASAAGTRDVRATDASVSRGAAAASTAPPVGNPQAPTVPIEAAIAAPAPARAKSRRSIVIGSASVLGAVIAALAIVAATSSKTSKGSAAPKSQPEAIDHRDPAAERMIGTQSAFNDQMCSCKDAKCVRTVGDAAKKWSDAVVNWPTFSQDQENEMKELLEKYKTCGGRFVGTNAPGDRTQKRSTGASAAPSSKVASPVGPAAVAVAGKPVDPYANATPSTAAASGREAAVAETAPGQPGAGAAVAATPAPIDPNAGAKPTVPLVAGNVRNGSDTNAPPPTLDRNSEIAGIDPIRPKVALCRGQSSFTGVVPVHMKVQGDGRVSDVTVLGTSDQALHDCISTALREATFAKTQHGASFSTAFTFTK